MKKDFSRTLPKTINFSPERALTVILLVFTSFVKRPLRGQNSIKSLWKGVRGDSPQCGEMSEGQRGQAPVWWNLSSERFFPDKYI